MSLLQKLDQVVARHAELQAALSGGNLDSQKFVAASKEYADLGPLVEAVGELRKAERELGALGPFSAEDIAALVSNAFIGAESLYLIGAEKEGAPVRQALRRFGDLIRNAETQSSRS